MEEERVKRGVLIDLAAATRAAHAPVDNEDPRRQSERRANLCLLLRSAQRRRSAARRNAASAARLLWCPFRSSCASLPMPPLCPSGGLQKNSSRTALHRAAQRTPPCSQKRRWLGQTRWGEGQRSRGGTEVSTVPISLACSCWGARPAWPSGLLPSSAGLSGRISAGFFLRDAELLEEHQALAAGNATAIARSVLPCSRPAL
jgi:hypothetical protein